MTKLQDRKFQLWEYKVSHGLALVRSPKDDNHETNIDIIFYGIVYICLPRFLDDVRIEKPTDAENALIHSKVKNFSLNEKLYVVVSGVCRHFVAASGFTVVENTFDIFDSGLIQN